MGARPPVLEPGRPLSFSSLMRSLVLPPGRAGQKPFDPCEKGAWTYFPKKARFPTLHSRSGSAPHFKFQTSVADECNPFVEARGLGLLAPTRRPTRGKEWAKA